MNQGIVMEIKNKKAIVLTKEGAFETVSLKKGQHVEIGSEIDIPVSKSYFSSYKKRISTIVAAAAVLVLFFTQYPFLQNSNLAVAAYVGVDINPSIEVGVNEKLTVVEVIPINDDGKIIVDQIADNYRNKPLSEFIDDTIELAKADGYLTENKDVLLTTTAINKEAQVEIEEKVNVIKTEIEQRGVVVTTLKGDESTRKEAKDLGVSTGKYVIYKESKENITIEETKKLSVTQIYEKIETEKKQKDKEKKNSKIEKNNKQEKVDKEIKKEQKFNYKQQKFEEKANNKNKEKNNDNNRDKGETWENGKSNNKNKLEDKKIKESHDDQSSKSHQWSNKDKNQDKNEDYRQNKQDDKKIKENDNKNKQKDKNNGNKNEN